MNAIWRHYKWDLGISLLIFAVIGALYGPLEMLPLFVLVILEISLSFDNAIVNARVLAKMSTFWQTMFMTVGILVAVFGMRFVFPIIIVALTAGLGFGEVVAMAINDPHTYELKLNAAHGEIIMLGGVFLLMIALDWLFEEREHLWITPVERTFMKIGATQERIAEKLKFNVFSTVIVVAVILFASVTNGEEGRKLLITGFISLGAYMAVKVISNLFEDDDEGEIDEHGVYHVTASSGQKGRTGAAALGLFFYLEMQDAAFSFDGVSGAFAITDKVVLIAAGLGIGAMFVRSMTVHLLRSGHLQTYRYLEHGAHWAIGLLALSMFVMLYVEINEYVTGMIGVVAIPLSVFSSIRANRRDVSDELSELVHDIEVGAEADEVSTTESK